MDTWYSFLNDVIIPANPSSTGYYLSRSMLHQAIARTVAPMRRQGRGTRGVGNNQATEIVDAILDGYEKHRVSLSPLDLLRALDFPLKRHPGLEPVMSVIHTFRAGCHGWAVLLLWAHCIFMSK